MAVRVERMTVLHEPAALAYLSRAPYENVYLDSLVRGGQGRGLRAGLQIATEGGRVRGVAYFGRQVTLAADPDAIPAIAARGAAHSGERMIVGPREQIAAYWNAVRDEHRPPRRTRDRQLVMAADAASLRAFDGTVRVRRARLRDAHVVAENSALMILHELEYDPRSENPDFGGGIRAMIERGLWWVGEANGQLCFFCNAGARSPRTLQLQGIWTPPSLRKQGFATLALSGICRALISQVPTLSLYVNDFNHDAIALYERVGFTRVAEFTTLLF